MARLLFKEVLLLLLIWVSGQGFLWLYAPPVSRVWVLYCLLLGLSVTGGSVFLNFWINKGWGFPALVFVIFSLLNQLLFLGILFIFLEPGEPHHRMIALLALAAYLITFIWDTRWKLKWIQSGSQSHEKNHEN